jgi:probable HAF family extracellular repeat protein
MRHLVCSAACAFALATGPLLAAVQAQAAVPSFQGLEVLELTGVSADGSVACGHTESQAFRWTTETGLLALPDLPGADALAQAFAISADGRSIVGRGSMASGDHAVRWRIGLHSVLADDLGDLPGGVDFSGALGVSADGTVVVGGSCSSLSGGHLEAFRWTDPAIGGGGLVGLGVPDGMSNQSLAQACSADGQRVAGWGAGTFLNPSQAVLWSGSSHAVLGDLPGGALESQALDITPDGATVVGVGTIAGGKTAFRWSDPASGGVGFENLVDLPGSWLDSTATAVSADGSVVVGHGTTTSGSRAFIWTEAAGMRPVEVVLAHQGLRLDGWILTLANDVSADGRTIVGKGFDPSGIVRGWIAHLAEETPATWTDLGGGVGGILGTPTLEGSGSLLGGAPLTLLVSGALGGFPAFWVAGFSVLAAPFKGGTLVPHPDLVLYAGFVPPSGGFSLSTNWPVGVPAPDELCVQYWVADPWGPAGFSATNGVKATSR